MKIEIRDYQPRDRQLLAAGFDAMADHLAALDPWKRIRKGPGHGAKWVKFSLARVRKDHGFILVAEADGQPAAIAFAFQRRFSTPEKATEAPTRVGVLSDLSVLPLWRGQGIGSALLHEVERRFRSQGCDQMGLGVFADNHDAYRLYEREGFRLRGQWMAKQLGKPMARWPATTKKVARRRRKAG